MPRIELDAYVEGDRIDASDGSIGYVRKCQGSHGPYLKVYVSRGPRTGAWIFPEKFGKPAIHWSEDGLAILCAGCDRRFRTAPEIPMAPKGCDHKFIDSTHCLKCGWEPKLTGLNHAWCRTCTAKERVDDQRRADSTDAIRVGDQRRRVRRG